MGFLGLGAACMALYDVDAASVMPSSMLPSRVEVRQRSTKPVRKRVNLGFADSPTKWRRGKRPQAKPKKRSNRLHMSKRVRRKHRRAA